MNHFSLMARFNAWVDDRIYDSVSGLSKGAYKQDSKAFFGSIQNTLNHLLVVDRLWTGLLRGTDRGIRGLGQILFGDFEAPRAARISEDKPSLFRWTGRARASSTPAPADAYTDLPATVRGVSPVGCRAGCPGLGSCVR